MQCAEQRNQSCLRQKDSVEAGKWDVKKRNIEIYNYLTKRVDMNPATK